FGSFIPCAHKGEPCTICCRPLRCHEEKTPTCV
uniref:Conotoxin pr6b n=1 Tax=Conus parius TaxID=505247 RepID=U6B_CONPI|nr:RecName: Full=Conotoxin pr6b [Conus parius]